MLFEDLLDVSLYTSDASVNHMRHSLLPRRSPWQEEHGSSSTALGNTSSASASSAASAAASSSSSSTQSNTGGVSLAKILFVRLQEAAAYFGIVSLGIVLRAVFRFLIYFLCVHRTRRLR
jgi:hypothetical protein